MVTRQPCSNFDLLTALLNQEGFTAFDSRCIEINLRPYLAPRIEYQYPNEPKQTIFSTGGELSYTLEEKAGQCSGDSYKIIVDRINNGADPCYNLGYYPKPGTMYATGKILGLKAQFTGNFVYSNCDNVFTGPPSHPQYILYLATELKPFFKPGNGVIYFSGFDINNLDSLGEIISIENLSRSVDCIDCTFKVIETFTDNSSIIRHQETREVCPTIEQFDCELSTEVQTITAKAKPFEIFFISDGYDPQDGLIDALQSLIDTSEIDAYLRGNPVNCFLLWKFQKTTGILFNLVDIAQVCSAKDCPPPEMNYRCLPCCESCPENTCAVECGNHICCYDNQGISVKEIVLENYCNE